MYAAFMAVGWFASRRVREGTAADLIVAGRAMPFWVAALTMTATWVDGGYLLGTTEGAYKSSLQLGIQGHLSAGTRRAGSGCRAAVRPRRRGWTVACVGHLHGSAHRGRRLDTADSATHGSMDARFRRRLVGRLGDADLRRHSVELLLS